MEPFERLQRFLDVTSPLPMLMARAIPGVVSGEVLQSLKDVQRELEALASAALPSDPAPPQMIAQCLADVTEWVARASESLGDHDEALQRYELALQRYRALDDAAAEQRIAHRVGELRVHTEHNVDEEWKRLHRELGRAQAGSLEHVAVLITLGEVSSRAGDDFGAVRWLDQAREFVGDEVPDADMVFEALADSVGAIRSGAAARPSSLEEAVARREMYRRLFLAYSNAWRHSDPEKSLAYASRAAALDRQPLSEHTRAAILAMLGKVIT